MGGKLPPWIFVPTNLEELRRLVLRVLLVGMLFVGTWLVSTNAQARAEALWPALIAWCVIVVLLAASLLRPAWTRYLAATLMLGFVLLDHVLGGQFATDAIRPGLVSYPVMLFLSAFFGSGLLLAAVGMSLMYELFRFPPPTDPVHAVMWSNAVAGFFLAFFVAGIFWFGVDRLEKTQHQQQEKLKASLSTKSALVATLFHDVASPLVALRGELDLAEDDEHIERAAVEEPVSQIWDVVQSARAILELERADVAEQLGNVVVATAVARGLQIQGREARTKDISLSADIDPELQVIAHPQTLSTTILGNLVSNAVKFCPSGGRIHVSARRNDDRVAVQVTNTGGPIAAHTLSAIMAGTNTASSVGTFGERGTGLGLQIVADFVARLAGELHVENLPGEVRATVVLPAARDEARIAALSQAPSNC